jgi:hypothetical protein
MKRHMERFSTSYLVVCVFEFDATSIDPSYKPLIINHKADLSAGWKLVKKGGGLKNYPITSFVCAARATATAPTSLIQSLVQSASRR